MTHKGFQVSFPVHSRGPQVSYQYRHAYRHACPEDEVSDYNEKVQELVAQGVWSEEVRTHYTNLIDDFNHSHVQSHWETLPRTAFPRHETLVAASFTSSISILEADLWHTRLAHMRINCAEPVEFMSKSKSKGMTLERASSVFTETTESQRTKLLAYSGIAGKLAARLFRMVGCGNRIKCQKSAFDVVQRVHSLQTCEILMNNRYWYTGSSIFKKKHKNDEEEIPIKKLVAEFRELYRARIVDFKCVAVKYKRGLINVAELQSDQIVRRFYSLWTSCIGRMMGIRRNKSESLDEPEDTIMMRTNRIMKFITEFPDIFHKDVSILFGLFGLSSMRKAIRGTQLRLASEGCYSAFLSFAVSEPLMVDAFLAPVISTKYSGYNDNHISSRHRVFGGDVLRKYRHHIPRTADVSQDVCRLGILYAFYAS